MMEVETLFIIKKPQMYVNVKNWQEIIGLKPLHCLSRGDALTENRKTRTSADSLWIFGITRCQEASVESQITSVLNNIHPKKEQIKRLVAAHNLIANLITKAWLDEEDAFIDFGKDIFKKLADLGASFQLRYCI